MQRRNLSFLSLQQLWTPELPLFLFVERTKENVTFTSVLCTLEQPRVRPSNCQASANKNEWQTSIRTLERTWSINTLEASVHIIDTETSIWTYKHLTNRCHITCAGSIPVSLEFFIDIILQTAVWPWDRLNLKKNKYQKYFLG